MRNTPSSARSHLTSLAPTWTRIYDGLSDDFQDDGCPKSTVEIDSILAGDPLASPPTGLGYNRPSLDAFLGQYVNSKEGVGKYCLRPGTKITAEIVAASSARPSIATLVNLIASHQQ